MAIIGNELKRNQYDSNLLTCMKNQFFIFNKCPNDILSCSTTFLLHAWIQCKNQRVRWLPIINPSESDATNVNDNNDWTLQLSLNFPTFLYLNDECITNSNALFEMCDSANKQASTRAIPSSEIWSCNLTRFIHFISSFPSFGLEDELGLHLIPGPLLSLCNWVTSQSHSQEEWMLEWMDLKDAASN